MVKLHFCARMTLAALFALGTSYATAAEAPKLPASAKKLDAAGIKELYIGKTSEGTNFENKGPLTFSAAIAGDKNTISGDWKMESGESGKINMTYRLSGNKWCYKPPKGKEQCRDIYVDGTTVYELKGKVVTSVNQVKN